MIRIEIVKTRLKKRLTPGATMGKLAYHTRLVSQSNGRILMSSESYSTKRAARRVAEIVLNGTASLLCDIVDETGDKENK